MFEKILVPLDLSPLAECVLPHALVLARVFGAQLVLFHVLSRPEKQNQLRAVDPLEWHLRRAEAESYLQNVCARLEEAGATCETQVTDGDAAEQIVDLARGNTQIGLVLISTHGQSGLSPWNVSSVAHKVTMRVQSSLMIVRAYQAAPADIAALHYERVLAPLDNSARAECILPLAAALARVPDTQIMLAHVVQRPPMPRRTPPSREDTELADRIVERNRSEAEQYLEGVRSQLPPETVVPRLLISDHVAGSLHELADQEAVDLVLLSAHGYSGDTRWPYGGLAAHFVAYGSSPLLIFQDAPANETALTPAEAAAAAQHYSRR